MDRDEIRRNRAYYRRQKIYGVSFTLIGLVCVALGEIWQWSNLKFMGDVVILFGLYVAITQRKLLY